VRDHSRNYCLISVGKFSCAVDCFLELCFLVFRNHLQNITCNEFFRVVYESCIRRQNLGAVEVVREPVWSLVRDHCESFFAMTAAAVLSDSENCKYNCIVYYLPRYFAHILEG